MTLPSRLGECWYRVVPLKSRSRDRRNQSTTNHDPAREHLSPKFLFFKVINVISSVSSWGNDVTPSFTKGKQVCSEIRPRIHNLLIVRLEHSIWLLRMQADLSKRQSTLQEVIDRHTGPGQSHPLPPIPSIPKMICLYVLKGTSLLRDALLGQST